jgi:hypothetical protein
MSQRIPDPEDETPPPTLEAKRPLEVQKRRGVRVWIITALVFVVFVLAIVIIGSIR